MKTPNVIHFIYAKTDLARPWSVVNHHALRLASRNHNPANIIMWTNAPEVFEPYGDSIEVVKCDIPTSIEGHEIPWPQLMADVMRLQILHEHGGIYMDTDILTLANLDPFLKFANERNRLVMSWETKAQASICNALMIAPAKNAFIKTWLEKIPERVGSTTWADGGVLLPMELANDEALKDTRAVLRHSFACPLDLSQAWLFDPMLKERAREMLAGSTAIHVFETYWRDTIAKLDMNQDTLFRDIVLNGGM